MSVTTFGPAFDKEKDGKRIATQIENLQVYMYYESQRNRWHTLEEIEAGYRKLFPFARPAPQPSLSADLRHLRKKQFGWFIIEKRRRNDAAVWEYKLSSRPPVGTQENLFANAH